MANFYQFRDSNNTTQKRLAQAIGSNGFANYDCEIDSLGIDTSAVQSVTLNRAEFDSFAQFGSPSDFMISANPYRISHRLQLNVAEGQTDIPEARAYVVLDQTGNNDPSGGAFYYHFIIKNGQTLELPKPCYRGVVRVFFPQYNVDSQHVLTSVEFNGVDISL